MSGASALEVILLRWGESADGRTVTFLLPEEPGPHPFKGCKAGRAHGQRFMLAVAMIADNEEQKPFEKKRSPLNANHCAILCGETEFHTFLEEKYDAVVKRTGLLAIADNNDADMVVKKILGIASKRELDSSAKKASEWIHLKEEYEEWLSVA